MRARQAFVWGLAAILTASGCNSSPSSSDADASAKASQETAPRRAVSAFLEALRSGDEAKVNELLTSEARQKTTEKGLEPGLPAGSISAYEVGEVELVPEGAHVASTLVEPDGEGGTQQTTVLWMLRNEATGWHIAGMAMKVFDNELPVILNFEDPEDMIRKQKLIMEEEDRRAEIANRQSGPSETEDKATR